ncbi:MAG: glutamate ligase domain-containing protein, partial [Mycobacteriales bacterium]
ADVVVTPTEAGLHLVYGTEELDLACPTSVQPRNLACALTLALAAGLRAAGVARAVPTLEGPPHRASVARSAEGVTYVDDTYNSNPVGAASALRTGAARAVPGRRVVVVSPGMVELGPVQGQRNREFAAAAGRAGATQLYVVGRTNRRSLRSGAAAVGLPVRAVSTRQRAVEVLGRELAPADVILFENDLPDHYP